MGANYSGGLLPLVDSCRLAESSLDSVPAAVPQEQTWTLSAVNVAPGQARRAVRDYVALLDLPQQLVDDILLCVSETVTNVVIHAYGDREEPGVVQVQAYVDDYLCITVSDTGTGMHPRVDSPGLGLGLPTISSLTSHVEVRSTQDEGTEVAMRFPLPPSHRAA
jgi:anti-sigma regulatory factor (Ser/Thr protein kinase)